MEKLNKLLQNSYKKDFGNEFSISVKKNEYNDNNSEFNKLLENDSYEPIKFQSGGIAYYFDTENEIPEKSTEIFNGYNETNNIFDEKEEVLFTVNEFVTILFPMTDISSVLSGIKEMEYKLENVYNFQILNKNLIRKNSRKKYAKSYTSFAKVYSNKEFKEKMKQNNEIKQLGNNFF